MKKNARVELRLPEWSKVRWQDAADGLGYPNLSSFIEDTIEQVHFSEPIVAAPQPIVTEEAIETEIASRPEHYKMEASPVVSAAQVIKTGCPGAAKHRKGTFCKSCKKVI